MPAITVQILFSPRWESSCKCIKVLAMLDPLLAMLVWPLVDTLLPTCAHVCRRPH